MSWWLVQPSCLRTSPRSPRVSFAIPCVPFGRLDAPLVAAPASRSPSGALRSRIVHHLGPTVVGEPAVQAVKSWGWGAYGIKYLIPST
eukprot:86236-Prorocentrum_minimum.AAC.1